MSLYQLSVLNKHLASQDAEAVKAAYTKYAAYFLNKEIQENIRNAKEEQFQQKFLMELFVNVFGYVMNPDAGYNLTTELKNIKDAKKTDGAILKADGSAIAVIELKGTDTKDLDKVNDQAFNYKNNQPDCVYVITSNFEKLRFFIHNAVEHEEFNLFTLTEKRFELLWLFLQKDNLLGGIPAKVKEESLLQEDKITKALYADYSAFKNDLWNDMVQRNSQHDPLLLYKKSQKLLDRFLFIFFSEDKGLLPPNSISLIVEQWTKLKELDEYKPLYDRFKKYFGYMNDGYKGAKYEIHAYNGGLFKVDELLDGLLIDDELLKKYCLKLTNYDFADEVDTNILGHIFEHSLNDIENVRARLEGEEVDKSKTKRKKDGVFYTPKYITKYIVDNTVGKLCEEKKAELGIDEEEFAKDRKGRRKDTIKKLDAQLKQYREWLLQLTICDPACGSGAFLNQALEFLMAEHRYVDELEAQLFEGSIVFQDVENHILENNIYGVDINEESVEIARLSLWLRTAQKGRKLTSLSSNIKCGNSLIDDPEVVGDLAFNWQEEFPKVFDPSVGSGGGFDVVIGNPPYVRQELIKQYSGFLLENYSVFSGKADLYTYFYELGKRILKENGYLSFISSGKFFAASYGKPLVEFLTSNTTIVEVIDFDDLDVFEGISAYPLILTFKNRDPNAESAFSYCFVPALRFNAISDVVNNLPLKFIKLKGFVQNDYNFISEEIASIFEKIREGSSSLSKLHCLPLVGIKTGYNDGFLTNEPPSVFCKPYVFGKDIKKYAPLNSTSNIIFPYQKEEGEYKLAQEVELDSNLRESIETNRERLERRAIIKDGIHNGTKIWYEYQQINRKVNFDSEFIVYPNVSLGPNFTLCKGNVVDMTGFIIPSNDRYLLALLNSKLVDFQMNKLAISRRGGYLEYKIQYLTQLPIKVARESEKMPFHVKVEHIIESTGNLNSINRGFIQLLQSKFNLPKPSTKLKHWPSLDFKGFLAELKKAKVPKLSLEDEAEWMAYFNKKKEEANELQSEIDRIDKQIDQMVYELYGLTEEEIQIVENN